MRATMVLSFSSFSICNENIDADEEEKKELK